MFPWWNVTFEANQLHVLETWHTDRVHAPWMAFSTMESSLVTHQYTKAWHNCHILHLLSHSLLKTCSLVCSSMQKSGKASYWVLSVSVSSYDWVTGRGSVRKEAWRSVHQSAFCRIWIKNWLPERVQHKTLVKQLKHFPMSFLSREKHMNDMIWMKISF